MTSVPAPPSTEFEAGGSAGHLEGVVAAAAAQRVVARAAHDRLRGGRAQNDVVARGRVDPGDADQAREAEIEAVIAGRARDRDPGETVGGDRLDPGHRAEGKDGVGRGGLDRVRAEAAVDGVGAVGGAGQLEQIVAVAAGQDVVAGTAHDRIIAVAAVDRIGEACRGDDIVAGQAFDLRDPAQGDRRQIDRIAECGTSQPDVGEAVGGDRLDARH